MGEYSKFISEKRRSVPTPYSIVRDDGICEFGTFDKEFVDLDLLKAKKPTSSPQRSNKKRLTLWEAIEIHFDQGILFVAISDMNLFGTNLNLFFDKRTKKVTQWMTNLKSKDTVIAPNLLDGNFAEAKHKRGFAKIINDLQKDELRVFGCHINKQGVKLEYDFKLLRVSRPSVVSIPFGTNRPMYTQKDLFAVEGKMVLGGEEISATDATTAIMDDHRGYYPRKMHYDWLSTMCRSLNGEKKYFAFNLTRNQSISQKDFNENLIWFEDETSLLPPVTFKQNIPTKKFLNGAVWTVKDDYDMVNLTFKIQDIFKLEVLALVVDIRYYIVFGVLEGYLRNEEGDKICLDGLTAMGEDKTMLF